MTEITKEEFERLNKKAEEDAQNIRSMKCEEIYKKYDRLIVEAREEVKVIKDPYEKETAKRLCKNTIEAYKERRQKEINEVYNSVKAKKLTYWGGNSSEREGIGTFIYIGGIVFLIFIGMTFDLYGIMLLGSVFCMIIGGIVAATGKDKYYKITEKAEKNTNKTTKSAEENIKKQIQKEIEWELLMKDARKRADEYIKERKLIYT